jgi:hypothetical protein
VTSRTWAGKLTACTIWSTALATAPGERVTSFRAVVRGFGRGQADLRDWFPPASETPGYPYSVQLTLEMFVKSMTWNVLPAGPCANPSFKPSERVGQAAAAPATVGLAAPVAGVAGVPGLVLADAAGVALTVIVLVGAGAGLPPLPHPAASAVTQRSAAPASTRPSVGEHGVIGRFLSAQAAP